MEEENIWSLEEKKKGKGKGKRRKIFGKGKSDDGQTNRQTNSISSCRLEVEGSKYKIENTLIHSIIDTHKSTC